MLIKEKMAERGLSSSAFARLLHYERTNIYKIFKRSSIDVDLLIRISEVLEYDFLREVYLNCSAPEPTPNKYQITLEVNQEEMDTICKLLIKNRPTETFKI